MMKLIKCQSCEHHICVLGQKVLCGYYIDREEREIAEGDAKEKIVKGCPIDK